MLTCRKDAQIYIYSVCPWKTETECIGSLKSHNLNVVSLLAVTTSLWVGWEQQCVSSWSWPEIDKDNDTFIALVVIIMYVNYI